LRRVLTRRGVAVPLLALTALAAALRLQALGSALWLDEAQAVAIARGPLRSLPGLLRLDGSPPLYYALLHVWMRVAGTQEARLHLLSVGLAALAVPAGWAAARAAATPRAAWICAALLTVNPLLSEYADQARMYTLLATLSLVALAALVGVLVRRSRAAVPVLAVSTAAMLYTHNWGFFLLAGFVVAALSRWLATGRSRALAVDVVLGLGGALVLYLPWVPHLVDQVRHTGAPWSLHPTLHDILQATGHAVGDAGPATLLIVVGGAGLVALHRRAAAPTERAGAAVVGVVTVVALALALAYCEVALAWAPRYLALLAGPLVVLGSIGLAEMDRLGLVAAAVAVAFSFGQPHAKMLDNKTNVARMARALNPHLRRGDLVISTQPEQVPALVRYLRPGLRYATPSGSLRHPAVMNWRDALARLRRGRPARDLLPLIRRLPVGAHVLLVNPSTSPQGLSSLWAKRVRRAKQRWTRDLRGDGQLVAVKRFARDIHAHLAGATALLLRRVGGQTPRRMLRRGRR
jgi:mannosyltransferase